MSFFKNFFSKNEDKEDQRDYDITNDSSSLTKDYMLARCRAQKAPYIDIKEKEVIEGFKLLERELSIDFLYATFIEEMKQFEVPDYKDEYRPKDSNKSGGVNWHNKELTSLLRSAGTSLIKEVGKKIISGDFNLTTISFPIKVMIPITILQAIAKSFFQIPYYLHLANGKDVVQRLKYVIIATISSFFCSSFFLKPMNPVLGETYEALYGDGTKIYVEQTSHHPPVSNFQMFGPKGSYYMHGHSKFGSSAGLNSLTVSNKGKRYLSFPDGVEFEFDFFKVSIQLV